MIDNKDFIEKIKNNLLEEKKQLLLKIRSVDVDFDGDETDKIQGNLILSVESQLSYRDKIKIKQIDIALKKINDKEYGLCEDCGEEISPRRLEVNHYFLNCISCAELKELELKRRSVK